MVKRSGIIATLLLVSFLVAAVGCSGPQESKPAAKSAVPEGWEPAPDKIKIGVVATLTGPYAASGQLMKNGTELALEESNAAGGIGGIPITLVYEDNRANQAGEVAATLKLILQEKVIAMLTGQLSTTVYAAAPYIDEHKIPAIFGGSAWENSELKIPWMFRAGRVEDRTTAHLFARFMVEVLGHTKIAAMSDSDLPCQAGTNRIERILKEKYGLPGFVVKHQYPTGTKDFTPMLLKVKASGATCLFSWGTQPVDDAVILKQKKSLGMDKIAMVGSMAYVNPVTIEMAGPAAEGVYSMSEFILLPEDKFAWAWAEKMSKKYGYAPDKASPITYDALSVLVDAMKRANIVKEIDGKKYIMKIENARKAIADALRKTKDFRAVMGIHTCDEYQNMVHGAYAVVVKGGKQTLISRQDFKIEEMIREPTK